MQPRRAHTRPKRQKGPPERQAVAHTEKGDVWYKLLSERAMNNLFVPQRHKAFVTLTILCILLLSDSSEKSRAEKKREKELTGLKKATAGFSIFMNNLKS